ncbi:MAG: sulfotransferase, partial [Alphaproteobacteria bacterium]|nr:sulfotransferase [Alphaproteobacteria bacterium]
AEKALGEVLRKRPNDPDALCLKGQMLVRLDRAEPALSLFARCIELEPENFVAGRYDYARLLLKFERYEEALTQAEWLLNRDSHNPLFLQLKADILSGIGEEDATLSIWRELAEEAPSRPETWIKYGNVLRTSGFKKECIAAYRKAIACRPSFGKAWFSLAYLKTFRFSDDDIAAMRKQLQSSEATADDRINLLFSLGKAHEDRGDYARSFDYYAKGNAARRVQVADTDIAAPSQLAAQKAVFTEGFFRSRSGVGCSARDPIFVLGRPRSGSTLVEQILASHPDIEGTAELHYVYNLARRLSGSEGFTFGTEYPRALESLDPGAFASFGEQYLESARIHRKLGRPYFIDKAPANYLQVGLIHLILPNAKIIDARRNPAACCLSMFTHNYSDTNRRLSELGEIYRDYVALMAHFDRVLPGRIHRVIYENMVADPEGETRRLLDYLELPFDERCLRFYETDRAVRTPSSEQVRRPISNEAVDHWRRFEPWLSPLLKSLGSVLTAYPDVPPEMA